MTREVRARLRARRTLGRRGRLRPVAQAPAPRSTPTVDPRLRPAVAHRPARVALGRARAHASRLNGPASPDALTGVDPASAGRDHPPVPAERRRRRQPPHDELVRRPRAHRGLGDARLSGARAGRGASSASGTRSLTSAASTKTTRSRPGVYVRPTLESVAARLTERRFDAIRLHGPGTDLTVGLFPSSVWHAADFTTVDGLRHFPNIPSEEMFTDARPARVDGHVTATRPLELYGAVIDGIRVEFRRGKAVRLDAGRGRRHAAVGRGEGRGRVAAGRARARRRGGTDRAARHDLLRDPPGRERGQPHRARQRLRPRRGEERGRGQGQPEQHSRRLHDRLSPSWTSTASPWTGTSCRCSAAVPGRSSASALPLGDRRGRGAGALEAIGDRAARTVERRLPTGHELRVREQQVGIELEGELARVVLGDRAAPSACASLTACSSMPIHSATTARAMSRTGPGRVSNSAATEAKKQPPGKDVALDVPEEPLGRAPEPLERRWARPPPAR